VIAVVNMASKLADRHDNRVGSAPSSEGVMKHFAGLDVSLEKAAAMANHASTRTTQLYDRRRDEVSLDEVERIMI
jgi:hypothetical protein